MQSSTVSNILIIIVSRIGDTLLTTPAIKSISDYYKNSEVTVLAHPNRKSILQNLPFVQHVNGITKKTAIWKGRFGKKYDLAFVYGFDENLVLYALRISSRVIAFEQNNKKINSNLDKSVEFPVSKNMHYVDIFMSLPEAVNIKNTSKRLFFSLTNDDQLFAERILAENKLNNKLLIGIQAVSFPTKSYRDWPIQHFSELCIKIIDKNPNAHFLIYGGGAEAEKQKADRLINNLGAYATSLIGMPLRETAAIMSKTDMYIGVDTGPTHMMSTFNIPMVVLFHCQLKSEIYGALEHPHYYAIDHPEEKKCSEDSAMSDISVETVLKVVSNILKNE